MMTSNGLSLRSTPFAAHAGQAGIGGRLVAPSVSIGDD